MNRNIQEVLKKIKDDKGEYLNKLIDLDIISPETVTEMAISSNNSSILYHVAKYIKKINQVTIANKIIELHDAEYLYLYAKNIKATTIILKAILKTNNAKYIFHTAADIIQTNTEEYENKIIELQNNSYIYKYALEIPEANINKLAKALMNSGKLDYVILFASTIDNAPVEELTDYIIESNNALEMYYFLKFVKDADRTKLISAIIKTKNQKVIKMLVEILNNEELETMNKELDKYSTNKKLGNNARKNAKLLYEAVSKNDEAFIEQNKEYFQKLFSEERPTIRTKKLKS